MNARQPGCLTFIFYQKHFYDKIDIKFFYFSNDEMHFWK